MMWMEGELLTFSTLGKHSTDEATVGFCVEQNFKQLKPVAYGFCMSNCFLKLNLSEQKKYLSNYTDA